MSHKILVISEFSDLSTGYAAYCRELLTALNKKYEVAEMARYVSPDDARIYQKPWKVYPVIPSKNNEEARRRFESDQNNIFGKLVFEEICLDFKNTITISIGDFWQEQFIDQSAFRDKFHWIWMVTADAPSQHEEWLDVYSRVDTLLTYNDWSKGMLIEESHGRLNVISEAPPAVSPDLRPLNKQAIKKTFGLEDKYIIGTVMRNQKRKAFPDLFKSFRGFLDRSERDDILLYCHTSYPDSGWDIPKLLNKYGLSSKVLFTYKCKQDSDPQKSGCGFFFPAFFSDAVTFCNRCKRPLAGMSSVKNGLHTKDFAVVYNMFDLYVQYSYLEGFGVPVLEGGMCGVPVMETDYSAMSDVVRKVNGIPLKTLTTHTEMETGREWCVQDNEYFINQLLEFFNKPRQLIEAEGNKALLGAKTNYSWDKTIKVWEDIIDNIDPTIYEEKWKSKRNIINENLNLPEQCSNGQFVRILLQQTLPQFSSTYFELKLVRQLNLGVIQQNPFSTFGDDTSIFGRIQPKPFSRQDCVNYIMNLVQKHNYWESQRA